MTRDGVILRVLLFSRLVADVLDKKRRRAMS
jgi:hypothetical protein